MEPGGEMNEASARRAGFTLIELLVVIAIIALLIGILIPALGRARDAAKMTKCLTQLKTLAQATIAYDLDKNRYPDSPTVFDYNVFPNNMSLYEALKDYAEVSFPSRTERKQPWVCPMDKEVWYPWLGTSYHYYPWALKQSAEVQGFDVGGGRRRYMATMTVYRINTHLPLFHEVDRVFHEPRQQKYCVSNADGSARFGDLDTRIYFPR